MNYQKLYNNPSYSRILIGSCLWSIRGQMHDWRHHFREFSLCVWKMAEGFENLANILFGWEIDKVQKCLAEALNRSEKQEEERYSRFFWKKIQKKYSSSLSRQSSKTKPSTNLVLVGREPLLCLDLNKSYRQNVSEINLFKKLNFKAQSQNNCGHTDLCQEWNIKTSLLKSVKINT